MRNPEDIPRIPNRRGGRPGRGRRIGLGVIFALIALGATVFRGVAVFYTDFLWFDTVALTSLWEELLGTKVVLGIVAVAFFFAVLWFNLWVVDKVAPRNLTLGQEDELVRQFQRFARPRAGLIRTLTALALAVIGGLGFYNNWNEWLLFRNGGSFGITDPQFDRDIGFFVFKLPFLTSVAQWVFGALIFAILISLVAHYLQGAIRPQAPTNRVTGAVKAHLSVLLGFLAIVRAFQYYLDRFRLSYSERGVVAGANYTDVNFLLPAFGLLMLISALAAVLFFVGARQRTWSWPTITVVLWGVTSILIGSLIPIGVQKLSVEPAESQKEAPYIDRNIDATRHAMGLDVVQVRNFDYTRDLAAADLQNNAQTIRNVRLWDPVYLQPSYKRLQESRSYFQFAGIDVDRYQMNGETTQMMLSVRELNNPAGLPQDRRSWVNQRLAFTHGYGAVASPANAVSANGEPQLTVRDLPPVGTPEITRPQVYFGETTPDYSIVRSRQGEVDFTAAEGRDQTSRYEGSGGVELSSFVRRVAFAARVGDINPIISELVTDESRAMYLTDIRERVRKVAPFLQYDNDPYPVISDGRILWMQDAYTTSNHYPYGQKADTSLVDNSRGGGGLKDVQFNYVRNSVKIVTDAYDGTMRFYVVDDADPVIKAYRKAFPNLFQDGSEMPAGLREHIRYPEDLFRVQSNMYGQYHLENPNDFYSRSDRWNIAQSPEVGAAPATTAPPVTSTVPGAAPVRVGEQRIEPYYLLMRLPGDEDESFLMFQPFVPFSARDERKELSAFMVAKSDPDEYGEIEAYVMPRGQQVDGPALAGARIQQDPTISQYITLLSREGSRVDLGNMLIIPIENSLLYVRPLYVTARQTGVPEFKKAIVVQGDRIAFADTLQQALAQVFGSAPATLEAGPAPGTPGTGTTLPPGSVAPVPPATVPGQPAAPTTPAAPLSPDQVRALLDQANAEFGRADQALRDGNLGAYQEAVRRGADLVNQARGGA